jgi:hypothetical protein
VTGYGRLDLSDWGLPDETYKVNVQKDGSGNVRGVIQISLSEPMVAFTAEPNCLEVSGNLAWLEGVVTRSSDDVIPVGTPIFFRIRDNGQGAASDPDAVSFLFHGAPMVGRCAARFGVGAPWPLTEGNIQVR